ncbi:tetratricopeptide repeat protein [uncultured Lacinutrix sp.]|uniref:tetratricopeptide repeat protein n=1 Tax=uncultured Lacinutrix sp. TaxID=574032 RepID=UPI00261097B3|nr:tetratricopeptide repeat protein [uncultured Lacinutrix sp.]
MKIKHLLIPLLAIIFYGCSKNIEYTQEFKDKTAGRYLYSLDEAIEVSFDSNNKLQVTWRGADMRPIAIDENTFTSVEMNKKLRFMTHPETKVRYITDVTEDDKKIAYDYKRMPDTFNVPSAYLKNKEYDKALVGYLNIQKEDSTSIYIRERDFNRFGYKLIREKKYEDAIKVLKINVALYPESDNVYDSLADAYTRNGDSLEAYNNYKKALEFNSGNKRAKRFVEAYEKK